MTRTPAVTFDTLYAFEPATAFSNIVPVANIRVMVNGVATRYSCPHAFCQPDSLVLVAVADR